MLAAALAAVIVAGTGAGLASSGPGDRTEPTKQNAWPTGPIEFNDPAVVKGARGGKKNSVRLPVFGDPTVRKGAGAH